MSGFTGNIVRVQSAAVAEHTEGVWFIALTSVVSDSRSVKIKKAGQVTL